KDSMYYVEKIIYKSGYYYVRLCYLDGNYYKNAFCVLDSQFIVVDEYDFTDEMIGWALSDDNQIVVIQYDKSDLSNCHFQPVKLDIKTGAIDELTVDSDLLEKYIYGQMCISEDGYIYSANKELTISKMNLLTGEETIVADLNNTNIDLFDYNCSKLLYCDDVNIVLVKQTFYPSEPLNNVCYSLSKMNSNPNVGKQILYVAPYFKVNSLAGSAIKQMNETSDNTYIYVTMKYSTLIFDDYDNVNDSTINQYNRDIALLNVLKQDIRNGEGPDVLLDFGRFSALNDGEYLYNLLSVVNDSSRFNRDDYFENIFDAFIKEDALYQMPVSVCIGGVYADESATNGAGFTYEEFIDYIGTACNGADPLEFEFGRDRCFYVMIKSSYNELYGNNHTFSANSDSFRSICKYVSTMNEQASLAINTNAASFQEFNGIHFDLSKLIIKDDRQLYGMPSISGDKGPIVFPYESVGITTCTSQFDSAFEFVNSLLSKDVQADNVSHNPINKEAFEYYAEDAIRYSNKYILENYGLYDYYDESIIDEYIKYICSANTPYLGDDYSILIMSEELQPFYQKQKNIDEVVDIIDSRVNKMIDENK
ncbi:MAG: ABC transporter substrate-binding protein, partial [Saccharofermentans sp.]|nr:ABC transporter substrate-binding protein [Saccharofermentans sp.]